MKELKLDLMRDEGLELKPYTDTVGKTTIGFGRNLSDVGITKDEAMSMLDHDVDGVVADLDRSLPWWRDMDEGPRRAICNMCFNLGIRRLLGFKKMLAMLEAGEYHTAAHEALDSRWAKQVGDRAERIADLIRCGSTDEMLG